MNESAVEGGPDAGSMLDTLAEEHRQIMELVARLEAGPPRESLPGMLETLQETLEGHFARETYPDGFYQAIGACTPEHRDDLRTLVDEHFRMLASLWAIQERVRGGPSDVSEDIAAFAATLARHERREHELAERLTGG